LPGAAPLLLPRLDVGFQVRHRRRQAPHVLVDHAAHAVQRGGERPRGGGGQRLRAPPLLARAHGGDACGAPRLARGALGGQSLAPLALGVRGGGFGVLGGALEERLELGAHRLVARVLRPHLGDARPELARLQRLRAHERRQPRRLGGDLGDVRDAERRRGAGRRLVRRGVHQARHVIQHRRRLSHRRAHVIHHRAQAGGAGVAARGRRDRRRRRGRRARRRELLPPRRRGVLPERAGGLRDAARRETGGHGRGLGVNVERV